MISDEISRINERLRERGVDIETERKLEQVCTCIQVINIMILISSYTVRSQAVRR